MREIKFRGRWLEKWYYGDMMRNERVPVMHYIGSKNNFVMVEPDTVGQFTGLYDAEGREIYEGDVIKVIVIAKSPKWDFQRNFVVEWSVDGWYMEGDPLHVWILLHTLKVIGNIHDNPGLLEDKKDAWD